MWPLNDDSKSYWVGKKIGEKNTSLPDIPPSEPIVIKEDTNKRSQQQSDDLNEPAYLRQNKYLDIASFIKDKAH